MIYGIGTDIIEIDRIRKAILRNPRFIERLFTQAEMEYYEKRNMNVQSIAGGFSAKEAVFKALGTGLSSFRWKDVEILRCSAGKPVVRFNAKVKQYVDENNIGDIHVTISHCKDFATATAIAEVSIDSEGLTLEDLLFQVDKEVKRKVH